VLKLAKFTSKLVTNRGIKGRQRFVEEEQVRGST